MGDRAGRWLEFRSLRGGDRRDLLTILTYQLAPGGGGEPRWEVLLLPQAQTPVFRHGHRTGTAGEIRCFLGRLESPGGEGIHRVVLDGKSRQASRV